MKFSEEQRQTLTEMAMLLQAEGKKLKQIYHDDLWKLRCDDQGQPIYPDFKSFCEAELSLSFNQVRIRMGAAEKALQDINPFEIMSGAASRFMPPKYVR